MKNLSPLPPGGHGHPPDPGSSLMGLVYCKESSGDLPGLWTSNQATSSRVQAGRKQLPSGSEAERRETPVWVSATSFCLPLWAAVYVSQENKRGRAAGMAWGIWMLAEHRLKVSSQKPITNVAPGPRVRAVQGSKWKRGKVQAILAEEPVCLLGQRFQCCPSAEANQQGRSLGMAGAHHSCSTSNNFHFICLDSKNSLRTIALASSRPQV